MYRGDFMPMKKSERWTDHQRETRQRYDAANYKTVGAKLRAADADAFRAACAAAGTTPSAYLAACALSFIGESAAPDQAAPETD